METGKVKAESPWEIMCLMLVHQHARATWNFPFGFIGVH